MNTFKRKALLTAVLAGLGAGIAYATPPPAMPMAQPTPATYVTAMHPEQFNFTTRTTGYTNYDPTGGATKTFDQNYVLNTNVGAAANRQGWESTGG